MGFNFSSHSAKKLVGLDIGHTTMKIMQVEQVKGKNPKIVGYGLSNYYPESAINNGVITNYDVLAQSFQDMLKNRLIGNITAKSVACTIPTSHTFNRPMTLPPLDKQHLDEAVKLEAEQYIPIPLENLYLDYDVYRNDPKGIDLILVATPKNIVDGTIKFLESVGLEPVALEPTMNAAARMFSVADAAHTDASLLIDFGSVAIDIAVFDQGMFVNSTISGGSDNLTNLIAKRFNISPTEAYNIKSQQGIAPGEKSQQIMEAARPVLEPLVREGRKIIRYYQERAADRHRKINHVITTGGGAGLKGLNEYLTHELGVPAQKLNPWPRIDFDGLKPPDELISSMFVTVAGEALLSPREIFS